MDTKDKKTLICNAWLDATEKLRLMGNIPESGDIEGLKFKDYESASFYLKVMALFGEKDNVINLLKLTLNMFDCRSLERISYHDLNLAGDMFFIFYIFTRKVLEKLVKHHGLTGIWCFTSFLDKIPKRFKLENAFPDYEKSGKICVRDKQMVILENIQECEWTEETLLKRYYILSHFCSMLVYNLAPDDTHDYYEEALKNHNRLNGLFYTITDRFGDECADFSDIESIKKCLEENGQEITQSFGNFERYRKIEKTYKEFNEMLIDKHETHDRIIVILDSGEIFAIIFTGSEEIIALRLQLTIKIERKGKIEIEIDSVNETHYPIFLDQEIKISKRRLFYSDFYSIFMEENFPTYPGVKHIVPVYQILKKPSGAVL